MFYLILIWKWEQDKAIKKFGGKLLKKLKWEYEKKKKGHWMIFQFKMFAKCK